MSVAGREEIRKTIQKRFGILIEDVFIGLSNNVSYPNAPIEKKDNEIRAEVMIIENSSNQVEKGFVKRFRMLGTMLVRIFQPTEEGDGKSLELADLIESKFRAVTDTSVVFRTPTTQTIGRVDSEWQTNVSCPFYADVLS